MSRQRELSESAKDKIRNKIASTIQSASLTDSNMTNDERQTLKRPNTDQDIVILSAYKGRVTIVMDKTDYYDNMHTLVNDKQTYEILKRYPTPALQRELNSKLLQLKKTDVTDMTWNRLRCRVPQPPKLFGLPKLHKPKTLMRPIVSFCGSRTYQPYKYLTTVLRPLTNESRHKLQPTENFIDAIKLTLREFVFKNCTNLKIIFPLFTLQVRIICKVRFGRKFCLQDNVVFI